jgi:hypothetical protein
MRNMGMICGQRINEREIRFIVYKGVKFGVEESKNQGECFKDNSRRPTFPFWTAKRDVCSLFLHLESAGS